VRSDKFNKEEWLEEFSSPQIKHHYINQFVEFANYLKKTEVFNKEDFVKVLGVLVSIMEEKCKNKNYSGALKDMMDLQYN
jgi:hypothetical protein